MKDNNAKRCRNSDEEGDPCWLDEGNKCEANAHAKRGHRDKCPDYRMTWEDQFTTAQAQVERLTEGLRDIRCVLGDFQEEWSAREASVDQIAKAALTPDRKGG